MGVSRGFEAGSGVVWLCGGLRIAETNSWEGQGRMVTDSILILCLGKTNADEVGPVASAGPPAAGRSPRQSARNKKTPPTRNKIWIWSNVPSPVHFASGRAFLSQWG